MFKAIYRIARNYLSNSIDINLDIHGYVISETGAWNEYSNCAQKYL